MSISAQFWCYVLNFLLSTETNSWWYSLGFLISIIKTLCSRFVLNFLMSTLTRCWWSQTMRRQNTVGRNTSNHAFLQPRCTDSLVSNKFWVPFGFTGRNAPLELTKCHLVAPCHFNALNGCNDLQQKARQLGAFDKKSWHRDLKKSSIDWPNVRIAHGILQANVLHQPFWKCNILLFEATARQRFCA